VPDSQSSLTYGRADVLPPIGEASANPAAADNVVKLILSRRQAIVSALARPLQIAKASRKIATWGEEVDYPDECKVVVHEIRQAIESQVSSHLKEPAKVTIEPIETGEYADWYWCGPPQAAMEVTQPVQMSDEATGQPLADDTGQPMMGQAPLIDPIYLGNTAPDGSVIPPVALPTALVKYLQQMAQMDLIDPTHLCKLDDEFTAKTLQKQFDQDWREAGADKWLRSRVYANVVEGWQLPHYEYDVRRQKHILHRNSIEQTYIDQSVEDIDDAAEAGIDFYLDFNQAIARYPQLRDVFMNNDAGVTSTGFTAPRARMGRCRWGSPGSSSARWCRGSSGGCAISR
jgi:hypothetical protein